MAVTTQESVEFENVFTDVPNNMNQTTEWHGRMRVGFVTHVQSGAGDATSSVALIKLPPGRVRLLMLNSYAYVNWTTASATLDLGWDAYTDLDGSAVAADVDGLVDGISVEAAGVVGFEEWAASAGTGLTAANAYTKVFESKDGVTIRASSTDTAIADGDDFSGVFVYVQD